MRIAVGSDDDGAVLDAVVDELERRGHALTVLPRAVWPDVAQQVAEAVASGDADQGMLFCWTGTGTSMAANKVPGVRAALVHDTFTAEMARKHNDANVVAMGARVLGVGVAEHALAAFRATPFEGGRHQRRVDQLNALGALDAVRALDREGS
jgi:ribose 5-phosphate isomerase B